jgi:phosphoglycerate dehydrogenase-like enzyme
VKVHLVGEAAEHEAHLRRHLAAPVPVVALPAEAATSDRHDDTIAPDDVVVSLRLHRPGGHAPPFRLLQVPGAGLDGVDLDALDPGTTVANVYEHEGPIAEFVLARMLEWEIRAGQLQAAFTPHDWPELYRRRRPHGEIHGRTLGIVGYGRIGRAIATRAAAFGMRVRAVDDRAASDTAAEVLPTARLDDVLATADYLVLACPLTPQTTGLIDRAALARMPAHAVLVSISRAAIVDQDALFDALRQHRIGGAVLDVWYRYPQPDDERPEPADRPFWELDNAWCTPHSCAWTHALPERRYRVIARNIDRLRAGDPLQNLVRVGTPSGAAPGKEDADERRSRPSRTTPRRAGTRPDT